MKKDSKNNGGIKNMTQEEKQKQKLILSHELDMMRMEHQHILNMMKIRGGWLGKLFGCN